MLRSPVRLIAGILVFAYFLVLFATDPLTSRWLDFPVYWQAAERALAHQTVYDTSVYFQYRYSPFIALLFGWIFQPLGYELASWIFHKASLLAWIWLFVLWIRETLARGETHWILILLVLLFFGSALRFDLQLGQVNSFTLLLLYLGMKGATQRASRKTWRFLRDNLYLALAIQLKLFCLIPLVFLVVRWKIWDGLATLGWLVVTCFGVLAAVHGPEFTRAELLSWLHLLGDSTPELMVGLTNVNILGVFSRLISIDVAKIAWGVALLGYAVSAWLYRRSDWFFQFGLGVAAIFFLHPLTWTYWVLFFVPIFLLAIPRMDSQNWKSAAGVLIVPLIVFNLQHSHWAKEWAFLAASSLLVGWAWRASRGISKSEKPVGVE